MMVQNVAIRDLIVVENKLLKKIDELIDILNKFKIDVNQENWEPQIGDVMRLYAPRSPENGSYDSIRKISDEFEIGELYVICAVYNDETITFLRLKNEKVILNPVIWKGRFEPVIKNHKLKYNFDK